MMLVATALLLFQAPDTLRLGVDEALRRAEATAPALVAAAAAMRAGEARVRQAGSWRNPVFNGVAENLGAQEQITGRSGVAGIEGQLTLEQTLTLGGDRGSAIREARALADAAGAGSAVTTAEVRAGTLEAIARLERDRGAATFATEEAAALARIAELMDRRAAEGRSSGGEAARTRLEAATVASSASRRRAMTRESAVDLARLLGIDLGTPIVVAAPSCTPLAPASVTSGPPDLALADFTVAAREAGIDRAQALKIPDLRPIAGLRRTAGFSGLLLGISLELPVMPGLAAGAEAARADAEAALAAREVLARSLHAQAQASGGAIDDLELAGAAFDSTVAGTLDRAVRAAFARYAAGEGTLVELLDARRARLTYLTEFEEWRAALRAARIRRARFSGFPLVPDLLCVPSTLEPR